ncbi:MAG: phosphatidylglycerophosphatase A [Planctomyces sp.]|nr:phosphatidylglycerophosphatase A [Planctomyces sp.]
MQRTIVDRLVLWICEGFGLGRSPLAPGTVGSLGGLLLAALFKVLFPTPWQYAAATLAVCAVGVPLCSRATVLLSSKDPQNVVLDEIAAVLLVFVFVGWSWPAALLGLAMFRALDITKPWPVSALERLPRGWGVMADDLFCGLLASLALYVLSIIQSQPVGS